MDVSHIVVGGMTAVSIAVLVWIEIRARRNGAEQEEAGIPAQPELPDLTRRQKKSSGR